MTKDNKLILFCGWVGATLLAFCSLPEVYYAVTTGVCNLSWVFLLMWFFGEIGALVYVIGKSGEVDLLPLLFNYGINIFCITLLMLYK